MTWHPDMPAAYRNAILTGDARELARAIPDGSVDLVFTDPVYERVEDYRWLAEEAARVLRPNSACLVWFQTPLLRETLAAFEKHLRYRWLLTNYRNGGPNARVSWGFCKYAGCLWFEKGKTKPRKLTFDVVQTPTLANYGTNHDWQKSAAPVLEWLQAFSAPEQVVWDPFTGGASVPVACKATGRNYVAFEIDPETATLARERVRLTPEPLLVLDAEPQQMTLEVV